MNADKDAAPVVRRDASAFIPSYLRLSAFHFFSVT
jgi:hypothetical protein